MKRQMLVRFRPVSLPPRGAWIEIMRINAARSINPGRSPHGERGLKYIAKEMQKAYERSLPPRGAWIEIKIMSFVDEKSLVAPPTGSVD